MLANLFIIKQLRIHRDNHTNLPIYVEDKDEKFIKRRVLYIKE